MDKAKKKITQPAKPRLKILVSSAVYGYEDLLESTYALLETFGYEVYHVAQGDHSDPKMMSACSRRRSSAAIANWQTLTLFRAPEPRTTMDLSSRQRQFLQEIGLGDTFKTADYAAAETISLRQARRELAELEDFGLIEKQGKGRATV